MMVVNGLDFRQFTDLQSLLNPPKAYGNHLLHSPFFGNFSQSQLDTALGFVGLKPGEQLAQNGRIGGVPVSTLGLPTSLGQTASPNFGGWNPWNLINRAQSLPVNSSDPWGALGFMPQQSFMPPITSRGGLTPTDLASSIWPSSGMSSTVMGSSYPMSFLDFLTSSSFGNSQSGSSQGTATPGLDKIAQRIKQEETVRKAYQDLLNREPDIDRVVYWFNQFDNGKTEQQLRAELQKTPEYQATSVRKIYSDLLSKTPNLEQLQLGMDQLAKGKTEQQLRDELQKSPEYRTHVIQKAYRDFKGQDPAPDMLKSLIDQMAAGKTEQQIREEIQKLPSPNLFPKSLIFQGPWMLPNRSFSWFDFLVA